MLNSKTSCLRVPRGLVVLVGYGAAEVVGRGHTLFQNFCFAKLSRVVTQVTDTSCLAVGQISDPSRDLRDLSVARIFEIE